MSPMNPRCLHRPEAGVTWQIGDGALLAVASEIDVVSDFRTADVEAGGEGAPLAPVYHGALATNEARPVAVLNIGGVANVTWIGPAGELIAFDTGPGNAMVDDWCLAHTGEPLDADGRLAASGKVDAAALAASFPAGTLVGAPKARAMTIRFSTGDRQSRWIAMRSVRHRSRGFRPRTVRRRWPRLRRMRSLARQIIFRRLPNDGWSAVAVATIPL